MPKVTARGKPSRPPQTMLVVMRAPVLARWMRSTSSAGGLVAFAFDVHHLPTDHAGREIVGLRFAE